jgi:RNA polymerase sigma factor (sigma-70 family)
MNRSETDGPRKNDRYMELYYQYYPLIFNMVYSKIHNEADAGDICQEIFLILYNRLGEVLNPRAWLIGVMKNVLLEYYRKIKDPHIDIDTLFDGPVYINGFRDARLLITEAIEKAELTEHERLILDYVALADYSYSNVGRILGMTKRQVGYSYQAVVKKISDYLKGRGIQDMRDML